MRKVALLGLVLVIIAAGAALFIWAGNKTYVPLKYLNSSREHL